MTQISKRIRLNIVMLLTITMVAAIPAYAEEAEPTETIETITETTQGGAEEPIEPEEGTMDETTPEEPKEPAQEPEDSIDMILDQAVVWITAISPAATAIVGIIVAMIKIINALQSTTAKLKKNQDAAAAQTKLELAQMLTDQIEEQQRQMAQLRTEIRLLSSNAQIKRTAELAEKSAQLSMEMKQENAKIIALLEAKGVAYK